MRNIVFHDKTKTFHLYNEKISYIMCVLENGHMGQIYFGKKIHDKEDFSYLVEKIERPMTSYIYEWDKSFSLEHIRQEYPVYGTTDYRHPAIELLQKNGSRISEFKYTGYEITMGKPKLQGLPAIYAESEEEAVTLRIYLRDSLTGIILELLYTIFSEYGEIARRVAEMQQLSHMSAQAVGGAVGHNKVSIIIPCHRVVGANGSLTGYAGGLDKKIALLELEHADMSRLFIPGKGTAL